MVFVVLQSQPNHSIRSNSFAPHQLTICVSGKTRKQIESAIRVVRKSLVRAKGKKGVKGKTHPVNLCYALSVIAGRGFPKSLWGEEKRRRRRRRRRVRARGNGKNFIENPASKMSHLGYLGDSITNRTVSNRHFPLPSCSLAVSVSVALLYFFFFFFVMIV